MPLPSGGQLSLSQIGTELQQGYLSLRSLSSVAGKGTPDAISEFWGYSAGGGGDLMLYSAVYYGDPCDGMLGDVYQRDGKYIFIFPGGEKVLTSLDQWYSYWYGEYPWIYQAFGIDKKSGMDRYIGPYESYCDPRIK